MPSDDEKTTALSQHALAKALRDSSTATSKATAEVAAALASLPGLLAEALARQPPPDAAAAAAPVRPRELRDRRVPDFWEHDPDTWFRILEDHLNLANPPLAERARFAVLLPLLTSSAVTKVSRLARDPPDDVFTQAKTALLKHFGRTEMDRAADLFALDSLGDRTAVDFLEHMRTLQPGEPETSLFRYIFVKALPQHARSIVAHHDTLDAMAAATDVILATVPAPSPTALSAPLPSSSDAAADISAVSQQRPLVDGLCFIHTRWGRRAYNCAAPDTCRMKNVTRRRRPQGSGTSSSSSPAPGRGNAPAGGQ